MEEHERIMPTPRALDRKAFAVALRKQGIPADFEDWVGVDDRRVVGLVQSNNPHRAGEITEIAKKFEGGVDDEI